MLVDSHCHLDFPELAEDLDGVMARADSAGVGLMITVGTRIRRHDSVLAMAERFPHVFASLGTHPHYADEEADVPQGEIVAKSAHPRIVALGEAGLDYHYDNSDRGTQRKVFRTHIAAARETGLPLIIHSRDAEADTLAILKEEMARGAFPALLHCFTGSAAFARAALEMGLYISFSGVVTFKKAEALREVAKEVPLDRLLVETDAPYLAPVPKRGKRNEPAFVAYTANLIAELRGLEPEELAEATTENIFRLFRKLPARESLLPA